MTSSDMQDTPAGHRAAGASGPRSSQPKRRTFTAAYKLAMIVMSHRDHSLVFTTAGLPPLPVGRSYQLWLMGPARRPVSRACLQPPITG